ncbi:MAG: hypothetical protein R2771_12120 [Saprospiraceae bacterium]
MTKIINIILLMFVLNAYSYSQDYAVAYFGPTYAISNASEKVYLPGYNFGIHALLGVPGFFMSPGLGYQKLTLVSHDKQHFFHHEPSFHILNINNDAGVEYVIIRNLSIRFFVGASLNYVLSIDENTNNIDFNSIYDANFSWDFGMGITFKAISLEYKIDKGLTGVYKDNYNYSNFTIKSLNLAFRF